MARPDDDAQQFFKDISRQAVGVARDASRGQKIPESVAKRVVGVAAHKLMEKDAAGVLAPIQTFSKLNQLYNTDWYEWEPETLWQTITDDGALPWTNEMRNLVMALQVVAKTNFPLEDWHIFENVGHAFAGDPVNFGQLQPLELDAAALAVRALREIRPGHNFDLEISGYLAACAKQSGVVFLPSSLFPAEAQGMLDAMGNDVELKSRVEQALKGELATKEPIDETLNIQTGRIREIEAYVEMRLHG